MSGTVLLLHGCTGRPEDFRAVIALSPPGLRPLAVALPGHDPARQSVGGFVEEVDRLAAELRRHERRGLHLCGYSMGARFGLALLVRHPELFARATLVGATAGISDPALRDERAREDGRWAELLERHGIERFVREWERRPMFASQARLPREVRAAQRQSRLRHDPLGLAASMRRLGLGSMPDLWPALGGVRLPVELMVGEQDAKFRALAGRMADLLPRARLTVVPEAGHNLVLEAPRAVAEALARRTELTSNELHNHFDIE